MKNMEILYLKAKEAYYKGEPIISDDEFDKLESELKKLGSDLVNEIGSGDKKNKIEHPTPMLSLSKYQSKRGDEIPIEEVKKWMDKFGNVKFEATPKYDGNAANVIYLDGKLKYVLSRGDGKLGRDITKKISHTIPNFIEGSPKGILEVRGEIVIKLETFNNKWNTFKNPRNFVAGVLNRDEDDESIFDLEFIPVEFKSTDSGNDTKTNYIPMETFIDRFKNKPNILEVDKINFTDVYEKMNQLRSQLGYQLDGFVIKSPTEIRKLWGENNHDPNWAVAIKFPPKETITKVIDIEWNMSKSGELTPVAIMDPVDLDGSVITKASLHNYNYIIERGIYPGSIVNIAKAGDIIPQIQSVITEGDSTKFLPPTHCSCGSELRKSDIHLLCDNKDCDEKEMIKFTRGVEILKIDGVGQSIIENLWKSGLKTPFDILDKTKFNKNELIKSGYFKEGKILNNLIERVSKIKELESHDVILMMGIANIGVSTAKQISNFIFGSDWSFHGLQKDVIDGFEEGGKKRERLFEIIDKLIGIEIKKPETNGNLIGCELTGSPKSFGFKTKEDFIKVAKNKGYYQTSLKDAKVLFTDDLNSNSSKLKNALSKGIKIMLYSDILK